MVYKWKRYSYRTDAGVAGEVCEELNRTVGLTPQNLVDASRAEDAPLHNEFEWDDTIAAEGYRKHQAAQMISNLAIVIEERKEEPVRAFFSLNTGFRKNDGIYTSTIEILQDEVKRETLLEKALKELEAFKAKYSMLTELAAVFEAFGAAKKEVKAS